METYQFAYQANRSVEDVINLALHHTVTQHLRPHPIHQLHLGFKTSVLNKLPDMNIDSCIYFKLKMLLPKMNSLSS